MIWIYDKRYKMKLEAGTKPLGLQGRKVKQGQSKERIHPFGEQGLDARQIQTKVPKPEGQKRAW